MTTQFTTTSRLIKDIMSSKHPNPFQTQPTPYLAPYLVKQEPNSKVTAFARFTGNITIAPKNQLLQEEPQEKSNAELLDFLFSPLKEDSVWQLH